MYFVNGIKIANMELINPPKLTTLINGTLNIFAKIEYKLKVLK